MSVRDVEAWFSSDGHAAVALFERSVRPRPPVIEGSRLHLLLG
jgi:hypothetical protein